MVSVNIIAFYPKQMLLCNFSIVGYLVLFRGHLADKFDANQSGYFGDLYCANNVEYSDGPNLASLNIHPFDSLGLVHCFAAPAT